SSWRSMLRMLPVRPSSRADKTLVLPVPFEPCMSTIGASNGRTRVPLSRRKSEIVRDRIGTSVIVSFLLIVRPACSVVGKSTQCFADRFGAIFGGVHEGEVLTRCCRAKNRQNFIDRVAAMHQLGGRHFEGKQNRDRLLDLGNVGRPCADRENARITFQFSPVVRCDLPEEHETHGAPRPCYVHSASKAGDESL